LIQIVVVKFPLTFAAICARLNKAKSSLSEEIKLKVIVIVMKFAALTTAFACASLVSASQDAISGGADLSDILRNLSSTTPTVNFKRSLKGKKKKASSSKELETEPEKEEDKKQEEEEEEEKTKEEIEYERMVKNCNKSNRGLEKLVEKTEQGNASSRNLISLFFKGYMRYLEDSGATITDQELYDVLLVEANLDPDFVQVEIGVKIPEIKEDCGEITAASLEKLGDCQDIEQDNVNIVMYFLGRNYIIQKDAQAYFSCDNADVFG